MKLLDKCQYLSKCALTPPLTKQQSTSQGMCAIAQILTLIQACYAEVITDAHLCPSNLTCQKTFLQKFRTHTCKYDDFRTRQRSKLPYICEGNDQFKIDESTVFPPRAEKDIKRESFSIYGSFSVCHIRNHPRTATEYKLCLKIFGYLMVVRVCYIQPLCQRIPSYS